MPSYRAPVEEVAFLLDDVLKIDRYDNLPGFRDAGPDLRAAILGEAARFSEQVLQPLNQPGDREGCDDADKAPGGAASPSSSTDATDATDAT